MLGHSAISERPISSFGMIFSDSGSGGCRCGASAQCQATYTTTTSGGCKCGGSAQCNVTHITTTYTTTTSGGCKCGASRSYKAVHTDVAGGGGVIIVSSGQFSKGFSSDFFVSAASAQYNVIHTNVASGGCKCGGSAQCNVTHITTTYTTTTSGGCKCGASASYKAVHTDVAGGGGVIIVSSGQFSKGFSSDFFVSAASAQYNVIHTNVASGGCKCGGSAQCNVTHITTTYTTTTSGGCKCGASASYKAVHTDVAGGGGVIIVSSGQFLKVFLATSLFQQPVLSTMLSTPMSLAVDVNAVALHNVM